MKPKPGVNNVEDVSSETSTFGTSATAEEQVSQIDSMLKSIAFMTQITTQSTTILTVIV